MKKTILIIFLLMISTVSAQIDISITEYDAVSQKAKIRLHNSGSIDYRDLSLSIENNLREFPGSLLKPDTAILIPVNIAPGEKNVVVKTGDGFAFSKKLNFAKDFDQVQQERERQEIIDAQVKAQKQEIQQVQEFFNPELQQPKLSKRSNKLWIILPLALIIIFLIFFFLKKPRKPKIKSYQKPMHIPKKAIIMPRKQHSPPQPKTIYQSPVSRVILHKQPKKAPEAHHKIYQNMPPQQSQDVFETLPKSNNAFDRIPSKNNKDIFDKLGALR